MRKLFFLLFTFIVFTASAQYGYVPQTAAGYWFKGIGADTMNIPTGSITPTNQRNLLSRHAAIYWDSIAKVFYVYDPPTATWIAQAGGTGSLSNMLTSAHIFVGNSSNIATDRALTGDAIISNVGLWTNTGLLTKTLPSLVTGYLKYNGSAFVWDNTVGTGTLTDITFTDGSGFNGTVTGTTIKDLSLTTTLATGSVPYIGTSGALIEDNSNFFYDNTNHRLGLGINTPASLFHIEKAYTLNGTAQDRMAQFWATITSDNGTADRYPRGWMTQLTTAGLTDFNGPTSEIIAGQGQTNLAVNVLTHQAYGLMGRVAGTGTNTAGRIVGLEGEITVVDPAVQTATEVNGIRSMFVEQGGSLVSPKYFFFNTSDSNRTLEPTDLSDVDTSAGFHSSNIDFGNVSLGFWQEGLTHTNIFDAPIINTALAGVGTRSVAADANGQFVIGSGGGVTVESDPVAISKTVSLINGHGIATGTATQTLNANPSWTLNDTGRTVIALATGGALNKVADSLGAAIGTKGVGTVTSVATNTGSGIKGGAITTTGTLAIDTGRTVIAIATGGALNKVADSLGARISGIHGTDTVNVSNVLSFGADSTGVVDATAAFNNAINAATIGGKMRVYAPHGTYKISITYLVSGGTAANNQGIQLKDGIELFGDGAGKTILTIQNNGSATTVLNKIFPVINGIGVSNCKVHDIEISGNKTNQGQYTTNPYTNPAGYYADTTNRWSTSGIQFKDGDNNEAYNIYAHDCQLQGVWSINATRSYFHHIKATSNGGSGTVLFLNSTGTIENVFATLNNSDQIRIDLCSDATKIINCEASWSGSSAAATNWFAGIYMGTSANVTIENCYSHDNSAYGIDLGGDSSSTANILIHNNRIINNGNGGIITAGNTTITDNIIKNNGKKSDGVQDTKSDYNPAAIVVNSAPNLVITGNRCYDSSQASQIWFIKNWGGGGSTGFHRSVITNNYIKGIADTAHLFNGNIGTSTLIANNAYSSGGAPILYGTAGDAHILQSNGTWKAGVPFTLTTTGTSGAATYTGGTLNIPQYSGGGSGVTTVGAFSNTATANALDISSTTITAHAADATNAGMIKASGSQTLGAVLTMPTPIFTTSSQVPLIIGGTGTTSTLTLQPTSGVGTTNADIIFKNGNNGATEVGRIINTGALRMGGSAASAASANDKLTVSGTTYGYMSLHGSTASSNEIIAFGQGSEAGTANNRFYSLGLHGTQTDANYGGNVSAVGNFSLLSYFNSAFNVIYTVNAGTNNVVYTGNIGAGGGISSPIAYVHMGGGTATVPPLRFTSGTLLTTPVAGAMEFNTDDYYLTISTSAARKGIILNDGTNLTSGRVPYVTTNGRLIDGSGLTFSGTNLTVGAATNIVGTATNNNAAAGNIEENVESRIAVGSAVSLTTATAANVTSISLTAGDWNVDGNVTYTEVVATVSARTAGVSSTSATLPTDGTEIECGVQSTLITEKNTSTIPTIRFSLSGTTTVYLVGKATFSAGTCSGYGYIHARRVR